MSFDPKPFYFVLFVANSSNDGDRSWPLDSPEAFPDQADRDRLSRPAPTKSRRSAQPQQATVCYSQGQPDNPTTPSQGIPTGKERSISLRAHDFAVLPSCATHAGRLPD